jgi:hypothetical protein
LAESLGRQVPYGIIFNEGRQLRIGHYPIEDSIDLLGDLTIHFQLGYISFHATGLHEP